MIYSLKERIPNRTHYICLHVAECRVCAPMSLKEDHKFIVL